MQYLYLLQLMPDYRKATNWNDEANRIVGEHFNHLKQNYEAGVVKFVGKTELDISDPENMGLCIFEADSAEAAEQFMKRDPAVAGGVMSARCLPFRTVFS